MIRKDFQPFNEEPVQKVKEEVEESISHTPIKQQAEEDRPREKLMTKGVGALTNAELLAILIGSGTRKENVLEVANRLLSSADGNLSRIADMDKTKVMAMDGIGSGRYASIAAASDKAHCQSTHGDHSQNFHCYSFFSFLLSTER